jgi:hypothetical protein
MNLHLSLNRLFYINENVFKIFIDEKLSNIPKPFSDIDLIISAWFESRIDLLDPAIDLLKSYGFKSMLLIYDKSQKYHYKRTDNISVIFVNFYSLFPIEETTEQFTETNRGLLLTGKLHKLNRIGLLKKLWDQQALDPKKILWSFPNATVQRKLYLPYLINDLDFEEFLSHCLLNSIEDEDKNNYYTVMSAGSQHGGMYSPNNVKFYSQTNYSIISETDFINNNIHITEKTYRAIKNHHPFIMAGAKGILETLKEFGFKTFENYLPISDYDSIEDPNVRLDAIVTNIIAFPNILEKFKYEIANDVTQNYQTLLDIISKTKEELNELYQMRDMSVDQITNDFQLYSNLDFKTVDEYDEFCNDYNKISIWINSYGNIKGTDWPNISNQKDIESLPDWIKEECINRFKLPKI